MGNRLSLWKTKATPANSKPEEFDVIFAGGGTSGGIAASRLAAADPSLRILVLEAGPHTQDDLTHVQPARFLTHLQPGSQTTRNVLAQPSAHLGGRSLAVQHGRCVGGGSSVNFMMYTRPPRSDYDDWAEKYDNPGWGFEDVLPSITKAETYQISPDRATHGYSGPLKVSHGTAQTAIGADYIATLSQYEKARSQTDDVNSMVDDINKYESWPKWIDNETGKRSDVAHSYLYKTLAASNKLELRAGCSVKRVIIENGRAVGVEYVVNTTTQTGTPETRIVRATRLVVLSAGAFGSPAILERSGIGAQDVLERNGVQQAVDLPGVGDNYHDHPLVFIPFHAKEDAETLDGLVRGDTSEIDKWDAQWQKDGTGLMATNGIDGGIKFRPTPEELAAMGPDVAPRWDAYFANAPDKHILWLGILSQYAGPNTPPASEKFYTFGALLMYPSGLGSVHITSNEDVNAPPEFDSGVLKCADDLAVMRFCYKRAREHGRRMASCRSEYAADHPRFPVGSPAATCEAASVDAPDIPYDAQDDAAIDEWLRANIRTGWHSLGTCAMKPRDQEGVVDPRLNVYGVEGLKVADLSICPYNVASNTHSVAIMIGEKAAALIGEDLGIQGV